MTRSYGDLVEALGRGEPIADLLGGARLSRGRFREGYDIDEVDRFLAGLRDRADGED